MNRVKLETASRIYLKPHPLLSHQSADAIVYSPAGRLMAPFGLKHAARSVCYPSSQTLFTLFHTCTARHAALKLCTDLCAAPVCFTHSSLFLYVNVFTLYKHVEKVQRSDSQRKVLYTYKSNITPNTTTTTNTLPPPPPHPTTTITATPNNTNHLVFVGKVEFS